MTENKIRAHSLARRHWGLFRRWGQLGGLAAFDQLCFSGANFLLHILLARSLLPDEYGGFVVAFALLLFLITVHNALVLEPMNVMGPARYGRQPRAYLISTLWLHFMLMLCFSLILALVGAFIPGISSIWRNVFLSTALYAPMILTLWFMRRFCYYVLAPSLSLWGSTVYILMIPLLLYGVPLRSHDGATTGMRVAGLAALCGCLTLGLALWKRYLREPAETDGARETSSLRHNMIREVTGAHWNYGRWLLAGGVLTWVNTALFAPYLGMVRGLSDAASLRAVENLFMPMQQLLTAGAMMVLPWLARIASSAERSRFALVISRLSWGAALAAMIYTGLVFAAGPWIFQLLYGERTHYLMFLMAVPVMGISVLSRAMGDIGIGCAVRVLHRTRWLFLATVWSTIITLLFSYQAIVFHGVYGALIVRSASAGVYAIVLFWLAGPYVWGKRKLDC